MKILLRGKNEQMLKVALNSLPCGNLSGDMFQREKMGETS